MFTIGDEVGGSPGQRGDSYIGGTLHVCKINFNTKSKTLNKEKRFTLIGLKKLSDKP